LAFGDGERGDGSLFRSLGDKGAEAEEEDMVDLADDLDLGEFRSSMETKSRSLLSKRSCFMDMRTLVVLIFAFGLLADENSDDERLPSSLALSSSEMKKESFLGKGRGGPVGSSGAGVISKRGTDGRNKSFGLSIARNGDFVAETAGRVSVRNGDDALPRFGDKGGLFRLDCMAAHQLFDEIQQNRVP